MNSYEENIMDRAYQSFVMGGDVFTLNFPTGKKAYEKQLYVEAAQNLEKEGMVEIGSITEKRMRMRITEKGIDFGNRQSL